MKLIFLNLMVIIFWFSLPVQAEVIFTDDFQDGQTDGWQAVGKGDVRLTKYKDNISLYLSQSVAVIAAFSTTGYDSVSVSLSFAAKSLEQGEYCIGEVSGDGGKNWHEIIRVGDGQDDAVTLHTGSVSSADLNDRDKVYLRARITGNKSNDICWLDNIRVSGGKIHLSQRKTQQKQPFASARLMAGQSYDHPVDMSYFAPSKMAQAPVYHFEGRLAFASSRVSGFNILKDSYHYGAKKAGSLPDFAVKFTSSGNDIIPVRRGIITGKHPQWDFIVEPGTVWNEPGEAAFSRAAIPFSLMEKNANCLHNGVMTFLFNNDKILSKVAFQISSETCLYFKFDMWGFRQAHYSPGTLKDGVKIIEAYQQEKSSRLPIRPISALATDYPGITVDNFGSASEVDPDHMTVYGVLVDGTHYVGGCDTRYGTYPYCDVMDLPSYSTAKSLFGGLALMGMEKLNPGIINEKIADYIPACKKSGQWGDVTFINVLDMATGNYDTDKYVTDEAGSKMISFFDALTHKDKITLACRNYKRKSRPGTKWVYHTSDSYILGTALQNYLTGKRGESADIYRDILVTPLWKKLNLSPVTATSRRTDDRRAQPFTGYGLTYHRDDVARIAAYLNSGNTTQFDREEFDKALQRDGDDRGLPAYGRLTKYNNGFWSRNFQKSLGCKSPIWIPFMSGYGGITIALLPQGMIYYYFSDNDQFAWKKAVAEAGKIKDFCK